MSVKDYQNLVEAIPFDFTKSFILTPGKDGYYLANGVGLDLCCALDKPCVNHDPILELPRAYGKEMHRIKIAAKARDIAQENFNTVYQNALNEIAIIIAKWNSIAEGIDISN